MFRPMRRAAQQVSIGECLHILNEGKRAAFSVNGEDGYPYTIPINYFYDQQDQCIYFHGAKAGHRVDAIRADDRVCFTVWGGDSRREGHWEWDVTSVVIFGRCSLVTDPALAAEKVRALAMNYYPSAELVEEEMKPDGDLTRMQLFAIHIDAMTGKRVNER